MLNKFEIEYVNLTSSQNKSFDSSTKQNVGQLLTVQCSSPKRNSKKTGFTHQNPDKKKLQFWKIKILGNSRREF